MNIIIDYDFNIHIKKVKHIHKYSNYLKENSNRFFYVYTYVLYKMIWSIMLFVEQFN